MPSAFSVVKQIIVEVLLTSRYIPRTPNMGGLGGSRCHTAQRSVFYLFAAAAMATPMTCVDAPARFGRVPGEGFLWRYCVNCLHFPSTRNNPVQDTGSWFGRGVGSRHPIAIQHEAGEMGAAIRSEQTGRVASGGGDRRCRAIIAQAG